MTLLFVYLFLALIISFICSIAEAVLLSTPVSYLRGKEQLGVKSAAKFIQLKIKIDKPLSAILTLNTIAHTVGAAGVGAEANKLFGAAYFGLVSAILTILILVLTEIIPKTIGATYWRGLSTISVYVINFMIIITYPLVIMSLYITNRISKNKSEKSTSIEEIAALANIGAAEGAFGEKENKIIQNLVKLQEIRVSEIMTPRVVVSVADENMTLDEFLKEKDLLRFSRIPVYSENDEHITGYVFRQAVFEKLAEDLTGLKLKNIKREIVVIPETKPLIDVWEILLEKKEHIALVVDEFGGMGGVVTMEDIIETLLGFEIVDEKDTISDMQQYARERWKMRQAKYRHIEQSNNQSNPLL